MLRKVDRMFARVFGWIAWQEAKCRLVASPRSRFSEHCQKETHLNTAHLDDFPPNVDRYEKLAAVWDEYATSFIPSYVPFLLAAGQRYGRPPRTALDLACGTGLLTRALAKRVEAVVGLDLSEQMLREARLRTTAGSIRYFQGDFHDFHLGERFDAVLCSGDSLNYVDAPEALPSVFRCVHQHLQPGGLFLFDVLDNWAFCQLALFKVIGCVHGTDFEIYHFYDRDSRVNEARVVVGDAVERHRRTAIETEHVREAARLTGMEVRDCFGHLRCFYVLQRPPREAK